MTDALSCVCAADNKDSVLGSCHRIGCLQSCKSSIPCIIHTALESTDATVKNAAFTCLHGIIVLWSCINLLLHFASQYSTYAALHPHFAAYLIAIEYAVAPAAAFVGSSLVPAEAFDTDTSQPHNIRCAAIRFILALHVILSMTYSPLLKIAAFTHRR